MSLFGEGQGSGGFLMNNEEWELGVSQGVLYKGYFQSIDFNFWDSVFYSQLYLLYLIFWLLITDYWLLITDKKVRWWESEKVRRSFHKVTDYWLLITPHYLKQPPT